MRGTSTPTIHAAVLRGRGTGMLVAAAFGALWANAALTAEPALQVWPVQIAIVAVTVALILAGMATLLHGKRLAKIPGNPALPQRRVWRKFLLVLFAEIVALNLVAWQLGVHELMAYLMPAIAIIVGLHFFPLARIFRAPHMHVTATVMTLAGIGAVLAMVWGAQPALANATADVVCALALWLTAGFTWSRLRTDPVAAGGRVIAAGAGDRSLH